MTSVPKRDMHPASMLQFSGVDPACDISRSFGVIQRSNEGHICEFVFFTNLKSDNYPASEIVLHGSIYLVVQK